MVEGEGGGGLGVLAKLDLCSLKLTILIGNQNTLGVPLYLGYSKDTQSKHLCSFI